MSKRLKYLKTILYPKLSWKHNIVKRSIKSPIALYTSKIAIDEICGLMPTITRWLYEAVVESVLLYGLLGEWCPWTNVTAVSASNLLFWSPAPQPMLVILDWYFLDLLVKQNAQMMVLLIGVMMLFWGNIVTSGLFLTFFNRNFSFFTPTMDFWLENHDVFSWTR